MLIVIGGTQEAWAGIVQMGARAGTMGKVFYELEAAAGELGVSVEEIEEMFVTGELALTKVGTKRRLVRIKDVEAVLERVRSGGRLRTRREFRAQSVEGALDRAGAALGVTPAQLSYVVLERGNTWMPGFGVREARIAVELPDPGEVEAAPFGDEDGGATASAPAGPDEAAGVGRRYYAPGQVALLMGVEPQEINLRIYRKELPASNINGYRWIPAEAVDRALAELSLSELETPPKPFLILTPPDSGLGTHELSRNEAGAEPHPLERKVTELEEHIKLLKHELRLEKARRAQDLEDCDEVPSEVPAPDSEGDVAGSSDGTRSDTLISP